MKLLLFLTIVFLITGCKDKYIPRSKEDLSVLLDTHLDAKDKEKYAIFINSLSAEEAAIVAKLTKQKLAQRRLELRKRADYLAKIVQETATKLDDGSSSSEKTDNEALTWEQYHKKENNSEAFVPSDETIKKLAEDMEKLEKLKQQKKEEHKLP